MKIKRIEITGFGKIHQQTFEFSPNNQLIFGENETGKSTIFQFIESMLFGFEKRIASRRDYTPKHYAGSFGGRMTFERDGKEYRLERFREENKGAATLFFPDGQTGDEQDLQRVLMPLNRELFRQIFCFHQEQLRDFQTIDEANLNRQLVSLGLSGSASLMKAQESANKRAEELFKPRGMNPEINQQLRELNELSSNIYALEKEQESFRGVLAQLQETKERVAQLTEEERYLKAEIADLQAILSEKKVKSQVINEMQQEQEVDVLAFQTFQEAIREANIEKGRITEKIARIHQELDEIEQKFPTIVNSRRRAEKKASKLGVYALVLSFVLSVICFLFLNGVGKFVGFPLIILGIIAFLFVGMKNQRNSFPLAKKKWEELVAELDFFNEEGREIEERLAKITRDEQRYLSQPKNISRITREAKRENADNEFLEMEQVLSEKQETQARIEHQLRNLHYEMQELLFEQARLEKNGSLDELLQKRSSLQEKVLFLVKQYAKEKTRVQLIANLLGELSVHQLPNLLEKASEYFAILTSGHYKKVFFEQKLCVEKQDGERFELISLSTGTRDQLMMSLRFAFLSLQDLPISPVIIDDGWLNYDRKRKEALGELFRQFGKENQILLFSSDERMREIYQAKGERVEHLQH
ncbi:AAA domain-containing protein [Pilibacter termitis]|uniref:AAA domain-containing protein n=1 Tax=Pilibacter termitis TaxID=263852 RepID=A0A1T4QXW7_9ENTE|nr:AAA family ATPase [Pilibacter termitis]SKA08600.1 AAA domain-containing protein [Pilibacter termitis]